jgi:hypothetical protein
MQLAHPAQPGCDSRNALFFLSAQTKTPPPVDDREAAYTRSGLNQYRHFAVPETLKTLQLVYDPPTCLT